MFQCANILPCLENADPPVYVSTQNPEISRGLWELIDFMSFVQEQAGQTCVVQILWGNTF